MLRCPFWGEGVALWGGESRLVKGLLVLWRRFALGVVAGFCVLGVGCLLVCSSASAEFSRPFLGALTGTPNGPLGEVEGCVATDPGEGGVGGSGRVWVAQLGDVAGRLENVIDEFGSSNVFLGQTTGVPVNSCAFDDAAGVSGELLSVGDREWVAADDSGGVSNGDVYYARVGNASERGYVERVNSFGVPAVFSCSEPGAGSYIKENRLLGVPGAGGEPELFREGEAIEGVAVSGSGVPEGMGGDGGDVYVINRAKGEVDVFSPEGCFVGAISSVRKFVREGKQETEEIFFERGLYGVAVDPVSGDVLVKGSLPDQTGWVVGEFGLLPGGGYTFLGEVKGPPAAQAFGNEDYQGGLAVGGEGDLFVGAEEVVEEEVEQGGVKKRVVVSRKDVVDEFGRAGYYPGVVTGEVGGGVLGSVRLGGTVRGAANIDGEDLELSGCVFEVVTEKVFKEKGFSGSVIVPCVLNESGVSPVGQFLKERNYYVHGVVEGLVSGETYEYRLVAGTSEGVHHGGVKDGEVESFVGPGAPVVGSVRVGGVSSSFADFGAVVDPEGLDTSYFFEYVDGAGVVGRTGLVGVGGGGRGVSVSQVVGGLLPGVAYRVRVVAVNGLGEAASGFVVFGTAPVSVGSGRGYELLTPPDKGDAEDMFGAPKNSIFRENFDLGYSSGSGDEFFLSTASAFGPFPAAGENGYRFARGSSGWSFQAVASPGLGVQTFESFVFGSEGGSEGSGGFAEVGVSDAVGGQEELEDVLVGPPGGPYTTAMSAPKGQALVVGASGDAGSVVIESTDHRVPLVPLALCESSQEALVREQEEEKVGDGAADNLFEWSAGRGCLVLVNVSSQSEGGGLVSSCGAVLGLGAGHEGDSRSAVSAGGSRIFFTAPDPGAEGKTGCWRKPSGSADDAFAPEVYMRVGGTSTLEVSAAARGVRPPVVYPSVFVGASADGSKVFFVTKTELTKDAVKAKTQGLELYECEVLEGGEGRGPECVLSRISGGESGGVEGEVQFVGAVSGDGSSVYFVAGGKLTADAPVGGGVYLYDTVSRTTTYVGPSGGSPNPQPGLWYESVDNGALVSGVEVGLSILSNYYTTYDGGYLLYTAQANVTGYDSGDHSELYRYDAGMPRSEGVPGVPDNPVCVSCDPDGALPLVGSEFTRSADEADNPAGGPPRPISEDGSYVFFDSAEALVPQATNGKVDVYVWHEGEISLVGSGEESSSSFFLDSSANGSNVFFGTHAQLVPQDTDSEGDLYDARICEPENHNPCIAPPEPENHECEGDACQSPPPAPIDQTPASLTFSGEGNVPGAPPPIKCAKGKHLSDGRCIKSATKKANKAKKAKKAKRSTKARRSGLRGGGGR